jgi:two-component system, NtrC family, nitrogen regulation sensor histidine kinase NtrY
VVPCDRRLLGQALTNLLQNAADAIAMRPAAEGDTKPAGAGHIAVLVRAEADWVCVEVEDDGVGLPQGEERDRLTEPYVTHKSKGTGLGLAIVKKIMEDHGGRLTLEDRDGGPGARAVLVLPTRSGAGAAAAADRGAESAAEPRAAGEGVRLAHGA